jgi:hypothetical protein
VFQERVLPPGYDRDVCGIWNALGFYDMETDLHFNPVPEGYAALCPNKQPAVKSDDFCTTLASYIEKEHAKSDDRRYDYLLHVLCDENPCDVLTGLFCDGGPGESAALFSELLKEFQCSKESWNARVCHNFEEVWEEYVQ